MRFFVVGIDFVLLFLDGLPMKMIQACVDDCKQSAKSISGNFYNFQIEKKEVSNIGH